MYQEEFSFERKAASDLLHLMRRHWKLVLIAIGTALIGALIQHILLPKYVAKGSLMVRTNEESPLQRVFTRLSGDANAVQYNSPDPSEEMLKILRSTSFTKFVKRSIAEQISNNTLPSNIYMTVSVGDSSIPKKQVVFDHIISSYDVRAQNDILGVYGYSRKPIEAEAIAAWVADAAQDYMVGFELREILETEKYLKEEEQKARDRIASINNEIDKFRADPNLVGNQSGGISVMDRTVAKIRQDVEMIRIQMEENELLANQIADKLRKSKFMNRATASSNEEVPYNLRGRLIDKVKDLQRERESLAAKEQAYEIRLSKLIADMRPQNQQRVFDLRKRLDLEHDMRQEILRQIFAARIYQISLKNKIRLHESVEPGSAIRDVGLMKKFGISTIIALFVSFILVFGWEQVHPVISGKRDFVHMGVRFIGSIPVMFHKFFATTRSLKGKGLFSRLSSVIESGVRTPETTAIQFLAARVLQYVDKVARGKKQAVSVVSSESGEGKTLISNSLAAVMGNFGSKVLMVEGDVLRVYGENMFGIRAQDGLAEVLAKRKTLDEVIQKTPFENVYYLTRGKIKTDPSQFHKGKFKDLLDQAKKDYDFVIVDTPAFTVGPEALTMAGNSDMTVVVASAHQTSQDGFSELIESLRARGVNRILGILNRTAQKASMAEAYYYSRDVHETTERKVS